MSVTTTTNDRQLDLIAKLLAQAEGTNHQGEADAFMSRAQQLATRHSIDLAMARAHTQKAQRRETPVEQTVTIGRVGQKGLAQYVRLFLNIADANDVECLIPRDSTLVYAYGFPSDIDLVQTLYGSLLVQMSAAAQAWLVTGEHKSQEVWSVRHREYRAPSTLTAKIEFMRGYAQRIGVRLRAAAEAAEAEAVQAQQVAPAADEPGALTSMALVLREKRAEVEEFKDAAYNRMNPGRRRRGSWSGERRQRHSGIGAARSAGAKAASNANLHGRREIGA